MQERQGLRYPWHLCTLSRSASVSCMQNVLCFSACKMNDTFSCCHIQCNRTVNAYRVADIVWQTEPASAHKRDEMNKQIGKTE